MSKRVEMLKGEVMAGKLFKIAGILFISFGFYALFVLLFSRNIADYDLWGYLSFGSVFWDDGYFPFRDVFSYTSAKPLWVYHEWLTGILYYFIYQHAGPAGLQLLRYILIILTIYLMYLTAIKKGSGRLSALSSLIPAMLLISVGYEPVRAQIFTYLFFALTLYVLECARKEGKWSLLWWLLPIQILWCNLHGGFVTGLGLIVLYILGDGFSGSKVKPLIAIIFPAVLVTLINPYGFTYWVYLVGAITMPRPELDEWLSVIAALRHHVHDVPVLIFLFLALLFLSLLLLQRKRNLTDLLIVVVTIYLGCRHIRHSVFLGLILGSYLPVVLSQYWKSWQVRDFWITRRFWRPTSLLAVFLAFFCFALYPSWSTPLAPSFALATPPPYYPAGAIKWIEANNFRGNILPHFEWGEFVMWAYYPSCLVAMDGRYETVYEEQVYREYFDFLLGRDTWRIFLTKYPHDMVLIRPNTRTHFFMLKEPSWRIAYSDRSCIVFIKSND